MLLQIEVPRLVDNPALEETGFLAQLRADRGAIVCAFTHVAELTPEAKRIRLAEQSMHLYKNWATHTAPGRILWWSELSVLRKTCCDQVRVV
jgi:hypothetical protein